MRAPKVRAAHLGEHRPVPARRAIGGDLQLVLVTDVRERAAVIAASVAGVVAIALALLGLVVIL